MLTVALACLLALAAITIIVRVKAQKAEDSGELSFYVRGLVAEQIIRREDDPKRFAIELMFLRAVPWVAFGMLALSFLIMGYFI